MSGSWWTAAAASRGTPKSEDAEDVWKIDGQ
jgi:hypothetical protein